MIISSSLAALFMLASFLTASTHAHQESYLASHEQAAGSNQLAQHLAQTQSSQKQEADLHPLGHLCDLLPHYLSRQLKLCKLIGKTIEASAAVSQGVGQGLHECRKQFRSERWNCTLVAERAQRQQLDQLLLTSHFVQSIGYRESAYVQAIAAAGIVHSIASACRKGSLADCACDRTKVGLAMRQENIWKWGGCSNNIRHGMLYAKHLVELLDALRQYQSADEQPSAGQRNKRFAGYLEAKAGGAPTSGQLCQKNASISQATHHKLIKSLLAKNSLEKHHEIRLAMNLHNNKVGRMVSALDTSNEEGKSLNHDRRCCTSSLIFVSEVAANSELFWP